MFRVEMLPAAHGDCLWIEYGTGREVHRILIDGGPAHTYPSLRERILHLPAGDRCFDLLVVTHIDADHIEGIIRLLRDAQALGCCFERIWFNGREQLNAVPDPAGQILGATQGEYLGILIDDYQQAVGEEVWNVGFADGIVGIDPAAPGLPDPQELPGGCRLTVLSPDFDRLLDLKTRWGEELRKARLVSGDSDALRRKLEANRQLKALGDVLGAEDEPMDRRYEVPDPDDLDTVVELSDALGGDGEPGGEAAFGSDPSLANGSSIALLVEYPADDPSVRMLLAGDAWPLVLEASITRLLGTDDRRLKLTGFKIPHHGSVGNVSESLLDRLSCKHYLVSTSGAVFRHPHARTVDLLLEKQSGRAIPRLHFNYLTETTEPWAGGSDDPNRRFITFHPKGLSLDL
jgi:hypothetical protein